VRTRSVHVCLDTHELCVSVRLRCFQGPPTTDENKWKYFHLFVVMIPTLILFHFLVLVIFAERCIGVMNCSSSILLFCYVYSVLAIHGLQ
jgi:hypothetical protein